MDCEGRVLEESPGWQTYTGQRWEDYKGWGWRAQVHPDERESIAKTWKQIAQTKSAHETESRVRSAEGEYRYFLVSDAPVLEDDGQVSEWVRTYTDICGYKMAENSLKEKNIALKEMLGQLEIEKKNLREQVVHNIEKLLLPILKRFKAQATSIEKKHIEFFEVNLKDLTGTFGGIMTELRNLTPKEIEICNMVRNGFRTKEIAQFLEVSSLTVNTHRTNIRRKLKISKEKINLTSHLRQAEAPVS